MHWVMSTTSGARGGMLRTHPVDDEVSINSGSGRKNRGQRKHDDFLGNRNLARSDNPEIADAALRFFFFYLIFLLLYDIIVSRYYDIKMEVGL